MTGSGSTRQASRHEWVGDETWMVTRGQLEVVYTPQGILAIGPDDHEKLRALVYPSHRGGRRRVIDEFAPPLRIRAGR